MPLNNEAGNVLSVRNLSFFYGEAEALGGVSFDVRKGDYVGLAGPNGAGKTTLIKTILGLTDKYTGVAELFGRPQRRLPVGQGRLHPPRIGDVDEAD